MKKLINKVTQDKRTSLILLLIGVFSGIVIGLLINPSAHQSITPSDDQHITESVHQNEIWTCSMHPQIKMDKPGKCPICSMDLIPLETGGGSQDEVIDPNAIVLTEAAARLAEIQTVKVRKGVPDKKVFLQGKIHADERNIAELTARFGGRIEKLFVNFTGQEVRKGEKLATIYSPGLVTAQRELLEAIAFKETRPAIYKASRTKLKLWDLTDSQIDDIEKKGEPRTYFDILSPITGTVTMRHVALGDYVKEGSALFQVVDLSRVWGMFDAYESDLPWIRLGDEVDFTVQALPGKNFTAKVSYIDPFINGKTRIAKVRVNIRNKERELKPEMFLNGIVNSTHAGETELLMVPKSSILWTGKRAVVYVKIPDAENPSFLYREVTLGPEAGAFYVISEGLSEGEEVATNGVFKIDAASQLQGLPSMMNPEGSVVSTGHNHGGMDMSGNNKEMPKPKNEEDNHQVSMEFMMQLTGVSDRYLDLKDAFVDSDPEKVNQQAQKVLDALQNVDMKLLTGDARRQWMSLEKELSNNLTGMIQMEGIEMKRSHFSIVSNKLAEAIETFGAHSKKPLYLEFCPMAFDNKGAYWISDSKEIRNPYFGDKMMKCGEVKKEL